MLSVEEFNERESDLGVIEHLIQFFDWLCFYLSLDSETETSQEQKCQQEEVLFILVTIHSNYFLL